MRVLMITSGYPPYLFSENICNGKLVMAMLESGIEVDVISRVDEGPSYGKEWTTPWDVLKPGAHIISYDLGNPITRLADVISSGLKMDSCFLAGIRWARRAYDLALELMVQKKYDVLMTRSPVDISHLVGYKLKKKTGIRWIANWNDPAAPIWPGRYRHDYSPRKQRKMTAFTEKLLRAADVNTFPSDSLREHFSEHFPFLRNTKTAILPHIGLIDSLWPEAAPRKIKDKLLFLHSGNLSAERDPETTFQALRKLIDNEGFTDFEFHIMGNVNDYTTGLIEKYKLEDFVKYIGSYPYMEALAIMQSYDMLVLLEAQLEKGIFFASKITDYLQTGLPILAISPKEGFASDLFGKEPNSYFANNLDSEDIYTTLKRLVADRQANFPCNREKSTLYRKVSPECVVSSLITLFR